MPSVDDLLALRTRQLHDVLAAGHPIEPTALDDTEYHGVALDMPDVVARLAWRTFKKVFKRDGDVLRGWNVAVEQQGVHGPFVDRRRRDGQRKTYWHYEVVPAASYRTPGRYQQGLMIDYGLAETGLFNTQRLIRDPLVALVPGEVDLLLGYSYVDLGVVQVNTPTFFVLSRGEPLTYDVPRPGA
ncbi:MAG: hypothetical protein H6733_15490 [Alphaproteobacteria bacterium]|nr:hypothetical protein [Alphaproteobacteria bacterium]